MSDFRMSATRIANRNQSFQNADAWRVRITNPRGEVMQRSFYMGYGHGGSRPTLGMVMESLITDASCAENCTDWQYFASEYGYEDDAAAKSAYNSCVRTADRLATFLTEDERERFADY